MACLYTIDNKNYTLPEFKAWLVEGGLDRLYPEGNYPWVKQEASNQDFPSVTDDYYTDYYLDALSKGNYRYQSLTGEDREAEQYNEAVKLFLHGDLTKQVKPKDLDGITLLRGLENIVPLAKAKNVSKVKDTFESISKALLPFMGKGDTRYYLNGLVIDDIDNKLIASNGHIIAVVNKIPEGTPADNPYYDDAARELDKQNPLSRRLKNIYNRFAIDGDKDTGSMSGKDTWIDGTYPDFTKLLDMSKQAQPFEISLDSLSGYANGLTKVGKFIEGKYIKANSPITITNGKESIVLNAGYVEHAANLLRSMGQEKATVKIVNNGSGLALESQDGSVFTYIAGMRDDSGKLFKAYDIKKADYANGKYSPEPELKRVVERTEKPQIKEEVIESGNKKLDDFGANIGGAKKDKIRAIKTRLSTDDIQSQPLSKIFPKDIIDNTDDVFIAAFMQAVRDSIPSKPKSDWRLKTWTDKVQAALSIVEDIQDNTLPRGEFITKLASTIPQFTQKVELLQLLDRKHWGRIGEVYKGTATFFNNNVPAPNTPYVSVEVDGRRVDFRDNNTVSEAIEQIKDRLGDGVTKSPMKFEVRGSNGKYFINKKGDPEYRPLKSFDDSKAAFAYISSNKEQLIKAWDDIKERDNIRESDTRNDENRERQAKDWRNGEDITEEQFKDKFGLAGGKFGKWVGQGAGAKERQWMLNGAYDAFMDLADILNIPTEAIGLNGKLGILFGAGGSGKASAHYSPTDVAINLTKTRGAGALAHEWFHAVDNYFHKQRDIGHGYITNNPEQVMVHVRSPSTKLTRAELEAGQKRSPNTNYYNAENWQPDSKHPEGVRPELEAKFADLVKVLKESPMAKRSHKLDKGKKPYWGTTIEVAARSFENYIIAKLDEAGYHNDYLANVKDFGSFKNDGRYPYHAPNELAPITKAFNDVFGEVKTKQTETGTALYSKGNATGSTIEQVKSWLPRAAKKLLDSGNLVIVQSHKDSSVEGAYDLYEDKIYLVADNLNESTIKSVISHELFHRAEYNDAIVTKAGGKFEDALKSSLSDAAKGIGTNEELEAYRRVKEAGVVGDKRLEEYGAYIVSAHQANPQSLSESLRKAIKDFIAAIRVFLIRSGLDMGFIKSLTPADLAAMSRYGAKVERKNFAQNSQSVMASTKAMPETITIDGKERPTRNSNGQLIHPTEEGIRNFWGWFGESKVVDDSGRPMVVYHGSPVGGFNIFDRDSAKADAKANSRKAADDGLGFWFTPSLKIAEQHRDKDKGWGPSWAIPEGEIFSTYLKIDNPYSPSNDKRITDALSINKDKNDGVIYTDLQEYVVFESTQIKSVENNGQFNANNPDIRYSKATDALSEFKRKAGLGPKKTLSEAIQHILSQGIQGNIAAIKQRWNEIKPSIEQGLFDKFLGIKLAEKEILGDVAHSLSGYISARLSTGSSSVMHALMLYGSPTWENGIIQKKAGSKGFAEILNPVKDDLENFTAWMVARRANRLYQEGKENNFTREEIDEGLALEQPSYQAVADDIADMNKAVLDLAQESGLIEPSARAMFESNDYIPFYRLIEGKKSGPSNKGGLTHQTSGIKMLKGGENPMSDPLGNMMQNWAHLIDASMKNDALNKTLKNLDGSRFIESVPRVEFKQALIPKEQIKKLMLESGLPKEVVNEMPDELTSGIAKLWGMQAPSDPDIVRVMRDGKSEYFRVNDAMLLTSLTAVNQAQYGGIFKSMRYMKRLLTSAVTADPTFMARNFIRDSMHSWTIAEEKGFKLGIDSIHGAVKSFKEEGGYIDMMFAGASFQGGYGNYNNPDAARETMDAALRKRGIKDLRGFKNSILDTPKKYWEMYRAVGDAIENASREAILENSKRAGDEKAKYLFEAKDLMDFSMQGSFALVRALSDMLPFFNARLVGLYRLAKAGKTKEAQKMILAKGVSIAMFSLALLALNSDNDDYEALEDWDKDQYWHFFFGDQHFRIPKPFELGLIFGTVPERSARALLGPDSLGKFSERMGHGALDTLSFNPVPQLFKPFVELYANKDMFTGRPIEGMADEGKLPSARYNERTSETMRELSSMLPEFLGASPKRLEHLMSGYLGALGMYALGATDVIVRNLTGMPELPAQRVDSLPIIRGFYQAKPALHTKYSTEFYEQLRNVEQIYRTINAYKNEGKLDEAKALYDENKGKLAVRKTLTTTNKDLSKMRKEIDAIYRSDLSSDSKREKIDSIMAKSNKMLQSVVKRTHPFFN